MVAYAFFVTVCTVILAVNVVLSASVYATDPASLKDDCFILCTISPNSVKCFRCKNRLPMRFGKRGGLWLTDKKPGSADRVEDYELAYPVDSQLAIGNAGDDGVTRETDLGSPRGDFLKQLLAVE